MFIKGINHSGKKSMGIIPPENMVNNPYFINLKLKVSTVQKAIMAKIKLSIN